MDPDQTAPISVGAGWTESKLFVGKGSKGFQQTTKADDKSRGMLLRLAL